ncbi:MAG: hypothetical protein R2734_03195 [Nocardioides sp.]
MRAITQYTDLSRNTLLIGLGVVLVLLLATFFFGDRAGARGGGGGGGGRGAGRRLRRGLPGPTMPSGGAVRRSRRPAELRGRHPTSVTEES